MILFFDTETTGLPNRSKDFADPSQPQIVQIAALLTEDDGTSRAAIDLTVKPNGWVIPPHVAEIHGITQEIAERAGIAAASAISAFNNLAMAADTIVAHNIQFDLDLVKIQYAQNKWTDRVSGRTHFCTCETSRDVVKMPLSERQRAAGYTTGYKQPKLSEVYKFAFGEELKGAHNALVDVEACKRVYFWLQNRSREAA